MCAVWVLIKIITDGGMMMGWRRILYWIGDIWMICVWYHLDDIWIICGWYLDDMWVISGGNVDDMWMVCGWYMWVISTGWYNPHIIEISPTYHPHIVQISSTYHQNISSTFHPDIIHISSTNYPDITHILSKYHYLHPPNLVKSQVLTLIWDDYCWWKLHF